MRTKLNLSADNLFKCQELRGIIKSLGGIVEYIFPLPRNAFPREGTGVKTDFFFREKVSLSAVVGKKDGCLTDRSSCLPKRSEGRQRREVRQSFRPETKERETFSRKRKCSWGNAL